MRLVPLISVALVASAPLFAQDWQTTTVTEDGFRANFPGQPTVEPITYETEFRLKLPGRVYRAADALGKYSTTVVDYRDVQRMHDERSATGGLNASVDDLERSCCLRRAHSATS